MLERDAPRNSRYHHGTGKSQWKIDDDMIDQLVQLVEAGNYMDTACAAVGINPSTLQNWWRAGRRVAERIGDVDPADFPDNVIPEGLDAKEWLAYKVCVRLTRAEAKAESYAVLIVRKHMPDQWTAAMTFLERRHPERWRKRQTTELVDGGVVVGDGLDEDALLEDEDAIGLLHEALERVAIPASGKTSGEVLDDTSDKVLDDTSDKTLDDASDKTLDDASIDATE